MAAHESYESNGNFWSREDYQQSQGRTGQAGMTWQPCDWQGDWSEFHNWDEQQTDADLPKEQELQDGGTSTDGIRPEWKHCGEEPCEELQCAPCTDCGGTVPNCGDANKLGLCRKCWHAAGEPWPPGPDRCKKCGTPVRQHGLARYFNLCQKCYIKQKAIDSIEEAKTWSDVLGDLAPFEFELEGRKYSHSTVYVGNIDYKITSEALWALVDDWCMAFSGRLALEDDRKDNSIINVKRCKYLRGGHGLWNKLFKTFAYVEFAQVKHAKSFYEYVDGATHRGRRLVAYPALEPLLQPSAFPPAPSRGSGE